MRGRVDATRRRLLGAAALAAVPVPALAVASAADGLVARPVARGLEPVPVIGMGTWLTFDIGASGAELARRRQVLQAFQAGGGTLIDSSPMYGRAEAVVGELLQQTGTAARTFSATKVWTSGRAAGERQMRESLQLWRLPRFDLMQIHNMVDWETHLATLRQWKAEGRIRSIGITTSHGRRHAAMEAALQRPGFDCVQFTYSLADRSAEARLLPVAAERGVAVIINRPFDGGALVNRLDGQPLPGWAGEIGCASWAEVCLKWIVSHPAVTCAIPATTDPAHVRQNMAAARGPLPDAALRRTIADHVARL
jgi:diketogulonate reductase-like aldo/keto reductase